MMTEVNRRRLDWSRRCGWLLLIGSLAIASGGIGWRIGVQARKMWPTEKKYGQRNQGKNP